MGTSPSQTIAGASNEVLHGIPGGAKRRRGFRVALFLKRIDDFCQRSYRLPCLLPRFRVAAAGDYATTASP